MPLRSANLSEASLCLPTPASASLRRSGRASLPRGLSVSYEAAHAVQLREMTADELRGLPL